MSDEPLRAERTRIEADLRGLQESHPGSRVRCDGYHPHPRPAGRTVIARFVVLYAEGDIARLCARCAYGLEATSVVRRLPLRYPELEKDAADELDALLADL